MPPQKVSKSIIVHHNRNANIIQSYGRYNDVMSHENFDQEYYQQQDQREKVEDLYNLDESIQVVPKHKQHKESAATGQTAATSAHQQYMLFEDS